MQKIFAAVLNVSTKLAQKNIKKTTSDARDLTKEARQTEKSFAKLSDYLKEGNKYTSAMYKSFKRIQEAIRTNNKTGLNGFEKAIFNICKMAKVLLGVFKTIGKVVTIIIGAIMAGMGLVYGAVNGSIGRRRESTLSGLSMRQTEAAEYAAKQSGLDIDWKAFNAASLDVRNQAMQKIRGNKSDEEWAKMDNTSKLAAIIQNLKNDDNVMKGNKAMASAYVQALGYSDALGMSSTDIITALRGGQGDLFGEYFKYLNEGMKIYAKKNYKSMVSQEQSFNTKTAQVGSVKDAALTKMGEYLQVIVDKIVEFVPKIYEKLEALYNVTAGAISSTFNKVKDSASSAFDWVSDKVVKGSSALGALFGGNNESSEFGKTEVVNNITINNDKVSVGTSVNGRDVGNTARVRSTR